MDSGRPESRRRRLVDDDDKAEWTKQNRLAGMNRLCVEHLATTADGSLLVVFASVIQFWREHSKVALDAIQLSRNQTRRSKTVRLRP